MIRNRRQKPGIWRGERLQRCKVQIFCCFKFKTEVWEEASVEAGTMGHALTQAPALKNRNSSCQLSQLQYDLKYLMLCLKILESEKSMRGLHPPSLQKLLLGFNLLVAWHRTCSYNICLWEREGTKRCAQEYLNWRQICTQPGRYLSCDAIASISNCAFPLCSLLL